MDYVVTALPRGPDVEKVLTMPGGVFESVQKDTLICDISTISPVSSRKFHVLAKEKDLLFCDTPVAGGTMGAQNKTLTFMVGCTTEDEF